MSWFRVFEAIIMAASAREDTQSLIVLRGIVVFLFVKMI